MITTSGKSTPLSSFDLKLRSTGDGLSVPPKGGSPVAVRSFKTSRQPEYANYLEIT